MQSPLFGYNEQQTQERYSLQNSQMLRVVLEGHDDILARKGTMVAYQGSSSSTPSTRTTASTVRVRTPVRDST